VRLSPLQLGPWPLGQDTFHALTHAVYQPSEQRAARLRAVVNVDLTDEGWPKLRGGFSAQLTATAGLSVFANQDLVLFQDGGSIYSVDLAARTATELVSGLSSTLPVVFHEHAGQVFWSNTETTGRILFDGTALNWGCSVAPTPTLSAVGGDLRSGRYMVAATFVDSSGIEHGAGKAAVISVDGTKDIAATLSSVDANAVYVKLYATKPNGNQLFFVKQVAVATITSPTTTTITSVEVSEEPLRTQFLSPPVAADGMFSYRGLLILFAENILFPSYGVNAHLYEIGDVMEARPTNVKGGGGLNDGFWTVCERGAFWTSGDTPDNWKTWQKDNRRYATGSLVLSGSLIPALEVSENVALFVSEHGLIAGLPGGALRPLTIDRLPLDVAGKTTSIIYCESGDLRQVLFSLE